MLTKGKKGAPKSKVSVTATESGVEAQLVLKSFVDKFLEHDSYRSMPLLSLIPTDSLQSWLRHSRKNSKATRMHTC
jgi:hypothetical protein